MCLFVLCDLCLTMLVNCFLMNLLSVRSPKCAANTGVEVDMSHHCFMKCTNGLAFYTASGSKV